MIENLLRWKNWIFDIKWNFKLKLNLDLRVNHVLISKMSIYQSRFPYKVYRQANFSLLTHSTFLHIYALNWVIE